jgi:hypothetical protein
MNKEKQEKIEGLFANAIDITSSFFVHTRVGGKK